MKAILQAPVDISKPCTNFEAYAEPRDAASYLKAVAQFDVANLERYKVRDYDGDGHKETFCNVFVSDVTLACSAPVPRKSEAGKWMTANAQAEWLKDEANGWIEADKAGAQRAANDGMPTVAVMKNEHGRGHIAMVLPTPHGKTGMFVAQAGVVCKNMLPFGAAFGGGHVRFYVHQ